MQPGPQRPGIPALVAVLASLVPFAAFWVAAPDYPRGLSLGLMAAGVAVVVACMAIDGIADLSRIAMRLVAALAIAWLALGIVMAGPGAALAFALSATAATALGARLLRSVQGVDGVERLVVAYLLGTVTIVVALSLVLRVPLHYPWTYGLGALAFIALGRKDVAALLPALRAQWHGWQRGGAEGGASPLAVVAAGVWVYGALGALTPVSAFDDLSYHLRLPSELHALHRYTFDVANHVWASAPWASDLAFAVPYVIGNGDDAVKTFVNASYDFASAVLLLGLLARRIPARGALLFLIAYLSLPMVMAANHALHTEGLTTALVLAIFSLWAMHRHTASPALVAAAGLMLGTLGAIKASNLVLCALLGLLWLPAMWRQLRSAPRKTWWVLPALATAIIPYAMSWRLTGNPVLPLFNAVFKSPYYYTSNFKSLEYSGKFDASLFQGLFLSGRRFLETETDLAAGLVLFFLLPAGAVLVAWRGDSVRRAALAGAAGFSLVLLATQQYIRYLFPAMGLALFAASTLWDVPQGWREGRALAWRGWWVVLLAGACAVSLASMPRIFWQTRNQHIGSLFAPGGRDTYLHRLAPERGLNHAINEHMGRHARVVYVGQPAGAELHGTPIYPNWYNHYAEQAAAKVRDAATSEEFLRLSRATHVVPRNPAAAPVAEDLEQAAREFESFALAHGHVLATSGTMSVIALDDDFIFSKTLWELPPSQRGTPVRAGSTLIGSAFITGGAMVLVDVQGECESLEARPSMYLVWWGRGAPLAVERCLADAQHPNGTFRMHLRYETPRSTGSIQVVMGALGDKGARITSARLRTLAQP